MEIKGSGKIINLQEYKEQKYLKSISLEENKPNPFTITDKNGISEDSETIENVFNDPKISNNQAEEKAKQKIIDYFRKEFIKSPEFISTFGNLKWEDISVKVSDSVNINRDKQWEKEQFQDKAYAFTGRIYGLYAEVVIDRKNGRLKRAYIEID